MNEKPQQPDSPLQFPCSYPLKVFGLNDPAFEQIVLDLLAPHCPADTRFEVRRNHSSKGKYLSLTITFVAHSRGQMDAIYHTLSDSEHIVMSL